MEEFSYLGSIVRPLSGSAEDVVFRVQRASVALLSVGPVCNLRMYSLKIKLSLFKSIVKSTVVAWLLVLDVDWV